MNIVTWNVLILLQPGKMNELADEVRNLKMDVIGLQEI